MLLELIDKEETDHYGDPSHLMYFRTRPESYRQLLLAVHETIKLRGLRMPIIPEDVFGRHEFLGGVHALRGMSLPERKQYYKSLLSNFGSDAEDEESVEPEVLEDPPQLSDLFELFTLFRIHTDVSDETHLKQLKTFFRLAEANGDLCVFDGGSEESCLLQYVIDSGEDAGEANSSEESLFFERHKINSAKRRGLREP